MCFPRVRIRCKCARIKRKKFRTQKDVVSCDTCDACSKPSASFLQALRRSVPGQETTWQPRDACFSQAYLPSCVLLCGGCRKRAGWRRSRRTHWRPSRKRSSKRMPSFMKRRRRIIWPSTRLRKLCRMATSAPSSRGSSPSRCASWTTWARIPRKSRSRGSS